MHPDIPQFYSAAQTLFVYLMYYTGLIFLYPLPADAFMVPLMTRHKIMLFGKMLEQRQSNIFIRMAFVVVCAMLRNSKNLYRHLRSRGVLVVVWVLNEQEEF